MDGTDENQNSVFLTSLLLTWPHPVACILCPMTLSSPQGVGVKEEGASSAGGRQRGQTEEEARSLQLFGWHAARGGGTLLA